jgi:hypothetical protein
LSACSLIFNYEGGEFWKMTDMTVTNLTPEDYWFGPLHLPANGSLVVDITTNASLYLTNDAVADALNSLYNNSPAKINVTNPPVPFPRPTGVPALLHGSGSPEGGVFAAQGSTYMRRDNTGSANSLYAKTTGVTISTGWEAVGGGTVGRVAGIYDLNTSTTETSLISGSAAGSQTGFLIPANTLTITGAIRLMLIGDYLNNTGGNQGCTLKVKFGGTVFYGDNVTGIGASATRYPIRIDVILANLGATNSNAMVGTAPAWGGGTPAAGSVGGVVGAITDSRLVMSAGAQAIDTTLAQYLDVTATHGASNANLSIRRMIAFAELL